MTRGARKLVALREQLGLTQVAGAAFWGVSQATLSDWEAGLKRPDVDSLSAIVAKSREAGHPIEVFDFVESKAQADVRRARRQNRHRKAS